MTPRRTRIPKPALQARSDKSDKSDKSDSSDPSDPSDRSDPSDPLRRGISAFPGRELARILLACE
jgi:hypothetical protein